MPLTYTRNGSPLLPLAFTNALILLLSNLSSAFEEHLAKITEQQLSAERIKSLTNNQNPQHDSTPSTPKSRIKTRYLVIDDWFKDDLKECLEKLYLDASSEYDALMKEWPGIAEVRVGEDLAWSIGRD